MCFSTALLNGNPVSAASEVARAKIFLTIPKVAALRESLMLPKAREPNFANLSPTRCVKQLSPPDVAAKCSPRTITGILIIFQESRHSKGQMPRSCL